jgi:hypothetical protein
LSSQLVVTFNNIQFQSSRVFRTCVSPAWTNIKTASARKTPVSSVKHGNQLSWAYVNY